jgi:hypothetical protein
MRQAAAEPAASIIGAMRKMIAVLLALAVAAAARADGLPAAGSPTSRVGESHGWLAIPINDPAGGGAIVHFPPRRGVGRTDAANDFVEGGVRLALRLPRMPERLAAWGESLWIVFSPEGVGERPVLTMTVERAALGGSWTSPEAEGRLPSLPQLPPGELIGFVGSEQGPVALMLDGHGRPGLLWMSGSDWKPTLVPGSESDGQDPSHPRLWLIAEAGGFGLVSPDHGTLWHGRFHSQSLADGSPTSAIGWTASAMVFKSRDGAPQIELGPVLSGSQLVFGSPGADGCLELWNPAKEACRRLATLRGVTGPAAFVPLDQVGRIAVAWLEPPSSAPPGSPKPQSVSSTLQIAEISALTGGVLYRGPAQVAGPVSATELKVLAVVLVVVMAVVLIIVLRPDATDVALSLPEGYALAEPGRRMLAAGLDLLVALVAAGLIQRVPIKELLNPSALLAQPSEAQSFALVIGAGIVHSTLGEWLLGASIGKLIAGCRVVRVIVGGSDRKPGASGPGLWGAFVRNAIRWGLPPVAMTGLNTPDHRHRGDLAAGTVVVVPIQTRR